MPVLDKCSIWLVYASVDTASQVGHSRTCPAMDNGGPILCAVLASWVLPGRTL